jgi:cytochrome c-type biogenesis protein
MGDNVSLIAAFGAGFLSFISPCVLPLIPGYLSFVSGVSLEEMRGDQALAARRQVIVTSLAFVLGFSLVFIALGASASALGRFLFRNSTLLERIAGALVIVIGLHTMGVFRLPFLETEKRLQAGTKPKTLTGAVLVGMAFGFGWTPCIGPILSGILVLAGSKETVWEGVVMLAVYSLGLGIPFLLTALAINKFFAASSRIRKHYHAIEVTSGLLLVGIGLLLFTGQMTAITRVLTPYLPTF